MSWYILMNQLRKLVLYKSFSITYGHNIEGHWLSLVEIKGIFCYTFHEVGTTVGRDGRQVGKLEQHC